MKQHAGGGACFQVQSVLAKLSLCRTRALGGSTYQCDDCSEVTEVYHSCGDRHCPQCSGCKRYDFAERAEQLILEGVTYYQVVFTLPSSLSEMALSNRESLADLLFQSAAVSLQRTIRLEQNYNPAAMMVLHTWNQRLEPHWHVHALVPGGGPSLSHDSWKNAQPPCDAPNSDNYYLVDAIRLRESFRKAALSRLRRLYDNGELKLGGKFEYLQDEAAWTEFVDDLSTLDWVSFIQPPPTKSSTADQVIRYLTRYLTGGPISSSRIVAADADQVTFFARAGTRVGGDRQQLPVTMETKEFVRRWCLHIQPDQLTKTRYFGGWSGSMRTKYQATCQRLLSLECNNIDNNGDQAVEVSSKLDEKSACQSDKQCPACEGRSLRLVGHTAKPAWAEVLIHEDTRCPHWYAETEHAEFCEYIGREYGVSYEDWVTGTRIESTMSESGECDASGRMESELHSPPSPVWQLYLPGILLASGNLLDC